MKINFCIRNVISDIMKVIKDFIKENIYIKLKKSYLRMMLFRRTKNNTYFYN